MSPELERRLREKYPKLYAGCAQPPAKSLMAFGFECDDGWFDLLDVLSAQLMLIAEAFAAKNSGGTFDGSFRATQVKEKLGGLRFYVGPCSDEGLAAIEFAEAMSERVCETCGNRGRTRGVSWFKTLCDPCAEAQGY